MANQQPGTRTHHGYPRRGQQIIYQSTTPRYFRSSSTIHLHHPTLPPHRPRNTILSIIYRRTVGPLHQPQVRSAVDLSEIRIPDLSLIDERIHSLIPSLTPSSSVFVTVVLLRITSSFTYPSYLLSNFAQSRHTSSAGLTTTLLRPSDLATTIIMAPPASPPRDLSHHFSRATKNRNASSIKSFYRFFQIPGIGQLAGGEFSPFLLLLFIGSERSVLRVVDLHGHWV